jgi:hypothetical protein
MSKLTGGLIVAAVALGILAVRNTRRDMAAKQNEQPAPPRIQQPAPDGHRPQDEGMIIQRNGPVDNGIAVRSPFNADPGIVPHARRNGRS